MSPLYYYFIIPGCSVFPGAAERHKDRRFNDAEKVLHEEDGAQVYVWFYHGEPLLHWGGASGDTRRQSHQVFAIIKKNMFLKQIRSLLLDYYWSWMSSDSSWKILFYHHIWDWPQKWLKISCLVRDFYISPPLRADTQHRPLSREHREEIFFLADREILTIYWEKKSHICRRLGTNIQYALQLRSSSIINNWHFI